MDLRKKLISGFYIFLYFEKTNKLYIMKKEMIGWKKKWKIENREKRKKIKREEHA